MVICADYEILDVRDVRDEDGRVMPVRRKLPAALSKELPAKQQPAAQSSAQPVAAESAVHDSAEAGSVLHTAAAPAGQPEVYPEDVEMASEAPAGEKPASEVPAAQLRDGKFVSSVQLDSELIRQQCASAAEHGPQAHLTAMCQRTFQMAAQQAQSVSPVVAQVFEAMSQQSHQAVANAFARLPQQVTPGSALLPPEGLQTLIAAEKARVAEAMAHKQAQKEHLLKLRQRIADQRAALDILKQQQEHFAASGGDMPIPQVCAAAADASIPLRDALGATPGDADSVTCIGMLVQFCQYN